MDLESPPKMLSDMGGFGPISFMHSKVHSGADSSYLELKWRRKAGSGSKRPFYSRNLICDSVSASNKPY